MEIVPNAYKTSVLVNFILFLFNIVAYLINSAWVTMGIPEA